MQQDETLLAYCTIYSPIDGVVLIRKVSAGQTVVAALQTPVLFTLASDLRQMELDVGYRRSRCRPDAAGCQGDVHGGRLPDAPLPARLMSVHNAAKTVQGVVTYQGVLSEENRGRIA